PPCAGQRDSGARADGGLAGLAARGGGGPRRARQRPGRPHGCRGAGAPAPLRPQPPRGGAAGAGLAPPPGAVRRPPAPSARCGPAGLTAAEARARLRRYGPNRLEAAPPVPAWRRFASQFADPLIYLLLAAVVVSLIAWAVEGAAGIPYEAIVITVIVFLNALL